YFVSYYDYYQPEAYIPQTDTYIEKDSSINDDLDRLRLKTTSSLLSRNDVIIVASVSCIYNLGSPEDYKQMLTFIETGQQKNRDQLLMDFINIYYERNDIDFQRGRFRVRGDTVEIFPAYEQEALRIEFFNDEIETIKKINPLTGRVISTEKKIAVYPAKHFVTTSEKIEQARQTVAVELKERLGELNSQNKLLEAQRLEQRTRYDMEMLQEMGYCHGVENYSRHLSGRLSGSRPWCLLDYFSNDFLTIIDESHVSLPQIRGMYEGDKARKRVLVDYGFRLPSCLDNRPLKFNEFQDIIGQVVHVSATPGKYELEKNKTVVEQIIRPTGLIDPDIIIKPSAHQIDDLIDQIQQRAARKERVLVTTLTKKMSEELADYLEEMGLRVKYLHSEIDALKRVEILRDLRLNEFDCLVGINLLREGLDLPEVSLVAIIDADKEGFLRSQTSLIQVSGRAARNINGQVIMYADKLTNSIKATLSECSRRRKKQMAYNKTHKITPRSIEKAVRQGIASLIKAKETVCEMVGESPLEYEVDTVITSLEKEMEASARNLQFERAIELRDQIEKLKKSEYKGRLSKKQKNKELY
ncbi:MAG: excinuclease ABC subunit UvrB, partial [Candidatus Omnitrophica bacterium]|nr:excinuclease ABC subunit UvrB [Candidatus Omnitrophota bacterium]